MRGLLSTLASTSFPSRTLSDTPEAMEGWLKLEKQLNNWN